MALQLEVHLRSNRPYRKHIDNSMESPSAEPNNPITASSCAESPGVACSAARCRPAHFSRPTATSECLRVCAPIQQCYDHSNTCQPRLAPPHTTTNQPQEASGRWLHVPISRNDDLTFLFQQQARNLTELGRASSVEVINAVMRKYEAFTALIAQEAQSWPLHSSLRASTFSLPVPSRREHSSQPHLCAHAVHAFPGPSEPPALLTCTTLASEP